MKIVELNKKEYKGHELVYKYQTKFYFDVKVKDHKAMKITLKRKRLLFKQEKSSKSTLLRTISMSQMFMAYSKKRN